jgi:hypothetical protein
MTNLLASISILLPTLALAAGCAADAAPASTTPAQAPVATPSQAPGIRPSCDASGAVLFEIDHELGTNPTTPRTADMMYAGGAWRSTDVDGKNITGCMTLNDRASARHLVETSPWTIVPNDGPSCNAHSLERVVFKARGATVWVSQGCAPSHLDDVSAKNLSELTTLMTSVTSRPAAEPR